MRDLTDTLKAAQEANSIDALVKIVLTRTGQTTRTYTRDRILRRSHPEEPYSQKATVVLDNSDGALTDLPLQGYKGVISYGAIGSAGEEYSACAPLWVISHQLESSPGKLDCTLELIGIMNLMAEDKASAKYMPESTDTKSVKTLINEILGKTLACFSHCDAVEVAWDAGYNTLADTYIPKDTFRIYAGGSRLAAFRRLIDYTGNVARAEADGKVHIFKPTTTGVVYASEYSLESGHTFFSKAYRKRVVIPGYIVVKSQPDDDPQYSGYAKDPGYDDLPTKLKKQDFKYMRLASSDPQANDIAAAILSKHQLWSEMGAADVPFWNVGAEVFDYVKVGAFCAEDVYRVGNIGHLTRHYNAERAEAPMTFTFGNWMTVRKALANLDPSGSIGTDDLEAYFSRLRVKDAYIENLSIDRIDAIWLDPDSNIDPTKLREGFYDDLPDGKVYARVKSMHLDAGILQLDENIFYKAGYDPNTKRRNFTSTPTTPYDVGDLWHSATVVKRCTTARATGAYVAGDWTQTTIDAIADGTIYQRAKSAALTPGGLVILDQIYIDTEAGAYDLVARADISAHHILLSKVTEDGGYKRYTNTELLKLAGIQAGADVTDGHSLSVLTNRTLAFITDTTTRKAVSATEKSGAAQGYNFLVSKLTAYGLSIYTTSGSSRVQLTAAGLKGYYGGALQVEIRASDGRIYAGGGNVILSSDGIEIRGLNELKFNYYGLHNAYIYVDVAGDLLLKAAAGYKVKTYEDMRLSNVEPMTHEAYHLGYSNRAWYDAYIKWLYTDTGSVLEYQGGDDIALLKAIKGVEKNGRRIIDAKTLPQDLIVENKRRQKYINIAGLTGFNIGVAKALLGRIEALEAKVGGQ